MNIFLIFIKIEKSLIVGLFLWAFGYKVYAGFAFGVFATRNWDLVKNFFKK